MPVVNISVGAAMAAAAIDIHGVWLVSVNRRPEKPASSARRAVSALWAHVLAPIMRSNSMLGAYHGCGAAVMIGAVRGTRLRDHGAVRGTRLRDHGAVRGTAPHRSRRRFVAVADRGMVGSSDAERSGQPHPSPDHDRHGRVAPRAVPGRARQHDRRHRTPHPGWGARRPRPAAVGDHRLPADVDGVDAVVGEVQRPLRTPLDVPPRHRLVPGRLGRGRSVADDDADDRRPSLPGRRGGRPHGAQLRDRRRPRVAP